MLQKTVFQGSDTVQYEKQFQIKSKFQFKRNRNKYNEHRKLEIQ